MTRINTGAAEIKIGNVWFPVSRAEINFSREGIEITSFQGPVSFLPTREIITWRAEIHTTEEFLQSDETHWFDNLCSLITQPGPVDYEIRLSEGINFCLRGLIDIDIELDYERDIRILRLTGTGEVPSTAQFGGSAGETISFSNPTFTDSGLRGAIHEQATELLCMFLEPEQAQEFKEHGRFEYEDEQNRIWKFIRKYHWPIEVWARGKLQRLCLDIDPEAPTEDLLLWVYLQVKGGRGDEVLETAKRRW